MLSGYLYVEVTTMLHIAICDDEQDFVHHLKTLLNQYADEIG